MYPFHQTINITSVKILFIKSITLSAIVYRSINTNHKSTITITEKIQTAKVLPTE